MKISAVLLLCLAWAQALHHHHVEDIDLEHKFKERIARDNVNIEVGEAKTRLQETGELMLDGVDQEQVEKLKYHVDEILGWWNPKCLKKTENNLKENFEDIKDDLPTTVNQLVKGLSELTQSEMEAKLKQLRKVITINVIRKVIKVKVDEVCLKNWKNSLATIGGKV